MTNYFNKTFRSYGTNFFDPKRFKPVKNRSVGFNKPTGGFWGSWISGSGSWKEFCINNQYEIKSLRKFVDFRIKPNSKVLILKRVKDFGKIKKFILRKDRDYLFPIYDWEKIARCYDVIIFDYPAVQREIGYNTDKFTGLDVWDVFSVLICNLSSITIVPQKR